MINEERKRLVNKLISGSRWEGECRVWIRCHDKAGYGKIWNGKQVSVHRLAWELLKGPIPDGLWVLHQCDNPPCWRVKHLFLGTALDNTRDMVEKGRLNIPRLQGSKHGNAKLSDEGVLEIREYYANNKIAQTVLGERFNVNHATINDIILRKTWAHL